MKAYPQNESTPTDTVSANDYSEGSGSQDSASANASQMQVSPPESSPMQQSSSKARSKSLAALQPPEKLAVLTQLFSKICNYPVETYFLQLAFSAMQHLKKNGR